MTPKEIDMTINYAKRNGLLPSASTQAALGLAQADIAYRVAKAQGTQGVPPVIAVDHAYRASVAILFYLLFIFPVMMFISLFVWTWNPIIMLWKAAQVGLGLLIGLRMIRWVKEPASNKLSYAFPTWLLVVLGAFSIFMFFVFAIVKILSA
jgi:hypothetical protein